MNKLVYLVGLPGSGKSYFANYLKEKFDYKVYSSDCIRKELYGDEAIQGNPQKIFHILYQRLFKALKKDKNCIFDATNVSQKNRINFLKELKKNKINCYCQCMILCTPLDLCIERDRKRERTVGQEVIYKMLKSFNVPTGEEGWDSIYFIPTGRLDSAEFWYNYNHSIPHENPSHLETIYQHSFLTEIKAKDFPEIVQVAARYHDIGKYLAKKVGEDGIAHYYNHENISAYLYMTSKEFFDYYKKSGLDGLEILYLIQCHMYPHFKSESAEKKIQLYFPVSRKNLNLLYYCDLTSAIRETD